METTLATRFGIMQQTHVYLPGYLKNMGVPYCPVGGDRRARPLRAQGHLALVLNPKR